LLTGFEPFGGDALNPSWSAVRLLASRRDGPADLHVRELPVTFAGAGPALETALDEVSPDIVIAVGLAGGEERIRVERVAINLDDARIPDNAGAQPIDAPILEDGPAAYFATLPVKAAVAAIEARGIPAYVSQTAGTFVCNHVFYLLQHTLATRPGIRGGFVHVPYTPEMVEGSGRPAMPVESIADALDAVLRATLEHPADVPLVGGAIA